MIWPDNCRSMLNKMFMGIDFDKNMRREAAKGAHKHQNEPWNSCSTREIDAFSDKKMAHSIPEFNLQINREK